MSHENNQINECRICYGDDSTEPFVNACNCIGSLKFVHASCIEMWRQTNPIQQEKCNVCKSNYKGRVAHIINYLEFIKKLSICFLLTTANFLSLYIPFLLICMCVQKHFNQDVILDIDETFETWWHYILNGHRNFCTAIGKLCEIAMTLVSLWYGTTTYTHYPSRYIGKPDFFSDIDSEYHVFGTLVIYSGFMFFIHDRWKKHAYTTYKKVIQRQYDVLA